MNSQQIRNSKIGDCAELATKKLKKASLQDCESAKKEPRIKPQPEPQKNKITAYLAKSNSNERLPINDAKPTAKREGASKAEELQQVIKEKDRLISDLKNKKLAQEERANRILFQAREYKRKAKQIIAKSVLEVAQMKRSERYKMDEKLGTFSDNMRLFTEGETLVKLRTEIEAKEEMLSKLQSVKKTKSLSKEELVRNIGSFQFVSRELSVLKNELKHRQRQLTMYKDRVKIIEKEMRSMYYKQGWPLVYDRYQTLELLGAGGFGEVYKCYDLETNRFVALKIVINKDKSQEQKAEFFKRVQRQTDIQKQLDHPNIAKFINLVEMNMEEARIVFELEYCNGIQLSAYLRKYQCLEEKQARGIIRQLFAALNYLFKLKSKVIHYDLKPGNIMFSDGVVKILDFGLCKVMLESEQSRMELTSQGSGTYWYLPPQTFDDFAPLINSKVDVWSLGVIFFELLYGQKPFANGISQTEIYDKGLILKAFKPAFPKETPKKYRVSEVAIQFITLCLKYNPDERPTPEEAFEHAYLKKE